MSHGCHKMSSRLDRLFVLLEAGGSEVTRKAAAQQLGEVVRLHHHELNTLLNRVHGYLVSKSWETRIAAGQAVEAIVSNIPQWEPELNFGKTEACEDDVKYHAGHLMLHSFSITRVLEKGSYLLGADEKLFELDDENQSLDPKERVAKQRMIVNKRLGLDIAENLGMDTASIVSNEDFEDPFAYHCEKVTLCQKESVEHVVMCEMKNAGIIMSSRELNRAKRKARILNKQKSYDGKEQGFEDGPEWKRIKTSSAEEEENCVAGEDASEGEQVEWPLESFCERLSLDLFSSSWETRHGAGTALREIIKHHGASAGKVAFISKSWMEECHQRWLEDKAVRLVCVLALDRFGDFLADQVVAPVRETCAQALGGILQYVNPDAVMSILNLLKDMLGWHEWGARHGGLLGMKYLLAVREDVRVNLLTSAYHQIYKGLLDEMDDVVAVAAACLVPVADDLVRYIPRDVLNKLLATLWDELLEIDDLTSSCNSILMLLAKLLSQPEIQKSAKGNMSELLPRLWPFLYHSSSSVRSSALRAICMMTGECTGDEKHCSDHMQSRWLPKMASTENGKAEASDTLVGDVSQVFGDCDSNLSTTDDRGAEFSWMEDILKPLLMHLYQRSLLETLPENLSIIQQVWRWVIPNVSLSKLLMVVCRLISSWLCLMMTNQKVPLDSSMLLLAHHVPSGGMKKTVKSGLGEPLEESKTRLFLGSTLGMEDNESEILVVKARCAAARLLGFLSHYVIQPMPGVTYSQNENPVVCYVRLIVSHLCSKSALQRYGAGLILRDWAISHPDTQWHTMLHEALGTCLTEVVYYDEIGWSFTRLQQETKDFVALLKHYKVTADDTFSSSLVLTLEQIQDLSGPVSEKLLSSSKLRKKVLETLDTRRKAIQNTVSCTHGEQLKLNIMVQAILAGAVVRLKVLPDKLNPVIKPLMDSIKRESVLELQSMSASDLTALLELCIKRNPSPNAKVVKNLASFLCVDEEYTPKIVVQDDNSHLEGILSLLFNKHAHCTLKRSTSVSKRGPGRPSTKNVHPLEPATVTSPEPEVQKQNEIQRRGCTIALQNIAQEFGAEIPDTLPYLWDFLAKPFSEPLSVQSVEAAQEYVYWLQLLEIVIPYLHMDLLLKIETWLSVFAELLYHPYSAVRYMCSRVLAVMAAQLSVPVMNFVIQEIVPVLSDMNEDRRREGAIECIFATIEKLGFQIVPYIALLIVPLLGRISDPNQSIRLLSTQCFATLIRLFPLDGSAILPKEELSAELVKRKEKERCFLDQLMDPKKTENYVIPVPIKAELRSYQQSGVNWLAFLNKYKLHGILCDDMGLGKTLQSICILAGDHYYKEKEVKEKKGNCPFENPACRTGVQSLVVCPPTLTGHWYYEIKKFVDKEHLNPLHYTGIPSERKRLREHFYKCSVIVASYKIIRNEIDFFSQRKWNYIILDEGHVIKNGKTKASQAIKELVGLHRLILSGTPIQNNVLELWSLFDFLMPGFLGTEQQFQTKYAKPILQSREPKSTPKEQEGGVLAMEALHRQTLPFLLRRVKEDVLKDLPPKITQDYYCELSPVQEKLYEDFARSHAHQALDGDEDGPKSQTHVFQALQYLRRVCNHPKLVLTPSHPHYEDFMQQIRESGSSLEDISHCAKLPALKQLLLDCGIGTSEEYPGVGPQTIVSPHRALIFCQLKEMLDIIEKDLLKAHMPSVTYLRLDGSVPAGSRHSVVQSFNSDPSIDILLLTTQVGGLGLNLTGADTVIFVEHDWNPMRDLQAMDRAHRIGQKKVVNVYRLITKGTLEEKIMSLQKFKLMTANTVISQENSSLQSMGTDQLLGLFSLESKKSVRSSLTGKCLNKDQSLGVSATGFRAALENLPELWDQSQYEEEYNLAMFLSTLKKQTQ